MLNIDTNAMNLAILTFPTFAVLACTETYVSFIYSQFQENVAFTNLPFFSFVSIMGIYLQYLFFISNKLKAF